MSALAALGSVPIAPDTLRIYPANLERETEDGTEVAWRVGLDSQSGTAMTGPFSACGSWFAVDLFVLGKYPIDEFLFMVSAGGEEKAVSVNLRALDIVLDREG